MLVRLLIAGVVVFAVLMLLRRARATLQARDAPRAIDAKTRQCARCGVYFPSAESVVRDGRAYCSEAHAREDSGT